MSAAVICGADRAQGLTRGADPSEPVEPDELVATVGAVPLPTISDPG